MEPGVGFRVWCDRQLNMKSWDRPGLSPVSVAVVLLIVASAVLFAAETEVEFGASGSALMQMANLAILLTFAVEFFLRLWCAGAAAGLERLPDRVAYAEPGWLALDFLAFAPELLLIVWFAVFGGAAADGVMAFKLVRLLRVGKLMRYLPGSRILVETIQSVWVELLASVTIAVTLIFLAAVLIHFAEGSSDPANFGSVPRALWWAVTTLTTVGYGDVIPHTVPGRIVAGAMAIVGVGLVALPSGIIAGAFIERLRTERARRRRADEETAE